MLELLKKKNEENEAALTKKKTLKTENEIPSEAVEEIKIYESTNPKQVKIYDHKPNLPPGEILSINFGYNQFEKYEILQ